MACDGGWACCLLRAADAPPRSGVWLVWYLHVLWQQGRVVNTRRVVYRSTLAAFINEVVWPWWCRLRHSRGLVVRAGPVWQEIHTKMMEMGMLVSTVVGAQRQPIGYSAAPSDLLDSAGHRWL